MAIRNRYRRRSGPRRPLEWTEAIAEGVVTAGSQSFTDWGTAWDDPQTFTNSTLVRLIIEGAVWNNVTGGNGVLHLAAYVIERDALAAASFRELATPESGDYLYRGIIVPDQWTTGLAVFKKSFLIDNHTARKVPSAGHTVGLQMEAENNDVGVYILSRALIKMP